MYQTKLFSELFRFPRLILLLIVVTCLATGCTEEPPPQAPKPQATAEAQRPKVVVEDEVPPAAETVEQAPAEREGPPTQSTPPKHSTDEPDAKPAESAPKVEPEETSKPLTDPRVERVAPIGVLQLSLQRMRGAWALAISPDGNVVAVGFDDGSINLHDVQTWTITRQLSGNKFAVHSLAFSADGKRLVSGGGDDDHAEINLWDLTQRDAAPKPLPPHEYKYEISHVALSPDGQHLLSYCLGRGRVMNLADQENPEDIYGSSTSRYLGGPIGFSPDGKFAVLADDQGRATVVQIEGYKEKSFRAVSDCVGESLTIDADGKGFILGDCRGKPSRAWDFEGNLRMEYAPPKHGVMSLALTPDGKYLIGGGSKAVIRIWERSSGRVVTEWNAHSDDIRSILLAHQGKLIVSTHWSWDDGEKTAITKVWSLAEALKLPKPTETVEPIQLTEVIHNPIPGSNESDLCLSSDGRTVYTTSQNLVEIHDLDTLNRYDDPTLLTKLLPDGTQYFEDPYEIREEDENEFLTYIELSSDGRTLLTADQQHRIRVWDTGTRTLKKTHFLHHKEIDTLLIAPDGKSFVSTDVGSTDLVCRQIQSGKEMWSTTVPDNMDDAGWFHPRPVCYSRDGKTLAIAAQEKVRFLDPRHGLEQKRFATPVKYPRLIALSAHDGLVAVGGTPEDGDEQLCVFAGGKQTWGQERKERFTAICFSADGRHLFSTVRHKPSEILDATDGKLVRVISATSYDHFVVPTLANRVVMLRDGHADLSSVSHLLDADLLATVTRLRKLNVKVFTVGDELVLDFEDSPAADEDLAILADLAVPFRLRLKDSTNLRDAALAHLRDQSHLVSIDLSDSKGFTDKGFAHLQGLPNLREVLLSDCGNITDHSMDVVAGFTNLVRLDISGTNITGKSLQHLKTLTQLRELKFSLIRFEPGDLRHLGALKELRELDMGALYDKVTADELRFLPLLKKLKRLDLAYCELSDEALKHLSNLTSLKALWISGNEITDRGCASLAQLTNLEELGIGGNPITDKGLRHFAKLNEIGKLNISDTQITGTGLDALAGLTQLRELTLYNMEGFTGQRLDVLVNMPRLTNLHLRETGVTDKELVAIAGVKQLKTLELPAGITDAGFTSLKGLSNLHQLSLDDEAQITGTGLVHLKNLLKLDHLDLSDLPITDAGLAGIAQLHQLKGVSLSGTKISDQGLKHLLGLPELQGLELGGTTISDQGLVFLEKITTLRTLGLERTKTTEAGRKRLEESIDNLFIRE